MSAGNTAAALAGARPGATIRGHLTLLVLSVALPLLGLAGLAVWDAYRSEREQAEERLVSRARTMAALVDREFGRAEALLRAAEHAVWPGQGDRDARLASAQAVGAQLGGAWVGIASVDGTTLPRLAWPDGTPPLGEHGGETAARALSSGQRAISPLIDDGRPGTHDPVLVLAIPAGGEAMEGVQALAAALPAAAFVNLFTGLELPEGWIATLLDPAGLIAARTLRPESTIGRPAAEAILRAVATSRTPAGIARDVWTFEGNQAVAAFARVPNSGYTAYVLVPNEVFSGPLRAALLRTTLIGGALALLGLGLAALAARRIAAALQGLPSNAAGSAPAASGFREVDEIAERLMRSNADRELAEVSLRESEARFRGTFEQAAVGMAHVALDGRWLRVNDRLCEIVGYSPDELAALTFQHITHPDDLSADLEQVRGLMAGEIDRYQMQKRYLRRDGSTVWILLTVTLVEPGEHGTDRFFISVVEDISELKAAQAALEASARRYGFLAETIPQIVWTACPDGRLDYLNRRWTETMGLAVEAGTGEGWEGVIHPDDLPAMKGAWMHSVATGEAFRIEHRARAANGSWRWFRTGAAPLLDANGRIEMWVGTAVDFNDEREALEEVRRLNTALESRVVERTAQLADANAELEAFAYSVAHDLRAPLRGMQGFSRALLEDYGAVLDATGQDYAGRIARGAAHLDDLIHDLLAYSRLSREEIRPEPVSLDGIVAGVLRQLEPDLGEVLSRVVVERPLPIVRGHGAVLTQVLSNLIGNALKFVAAGAEAKVVVRAERRGGRVRVWVEDNGIGIRPEHQRKVFRVFERLHGQRAYPGTGIGLAIVKKGIERLGGAVGVESELGRGSRFWFELPQERTNGNV